VNHDDLVKRAVKWLKSAIYAKNPKPTGTLDKVWYKPACGVAVPELVSGNYGEIPDAFGWDRDNSWLVECKASRSDFLANRRKLTTGIASYRFFLCPPAIVSVGELPDGWGLLYCHAKKISVAAWPIKNTHRNIRGEMSMMYSLLRRVELRGQLRRCLAPKWGGDRKSSVTVGGSEPGSTKQRLDMLDQFEEAERISEHVSSLTETVPDQGKDDG